MSNPHGPLRVGVGGPVGSGKTALMDGLCKRMRDRFELAAITNDIYTREDAEFLIRSGALPPERIRGVETGGCPHTAIREDASINLAAVAEMTRLFPAVDLAILANEQGRADLDDQPLGLGQGRSGGGRRSNSLSALGGGEGWGEVGDSRARPGPHLTLLSAARWVPSLSPLKGGEGFLRGIGLRLHHALTRGASAEVCRAVSMVRANAPRT